MIFGPFKIDCFIHHIASQRYSTQNIFVLCKGNTIVTGFIYSLHAVKFQLAVCTVFYRSITCDNKTTEGENSSAFHNSAYVMHHMLNIWIRLQLSSCIWIKYWSHNTYNFLSLYQWSIVLHDSTQWSYFYKPDFSFIILQLIEFLFVLAFWDSLNRSIHNIAKTTQNEAIAAT